MKTGISVFLIIFIIKRILHCTKLVKNCIAKKNILNNNQNNIPNILYTTWLVRLCSLFNG